jgi:hypothetical protein
MLVLLCSWASLWQTGSPPLRADAKTLYLVTATHDIGIASVPAQWHWTTLGLPGGLFVAAPFHPTGAADEALEIDVQIKDEAMSFHSDDAFGIVVGMTSDGTGYVCGQTLNQKSILSYPGWDLRAIQSETTTGVYGEWAHYVTISVVIRQRVITLSYDGKQVAQATVIKSPTVGAIGLFSSGGATVQGFRIEQLS